MAPVVNLQRSPRDDPFMLQFRACPQGRRVRRTGFVARERARTRPRRRNTPNELSHRERYKVLTGFVLPRPIAWVTTIGPTGVVNAAPFSFFNVFCEDPPLCMFAANLRPDGRVKDTTANIQRTGEFVVNLAD